MHKGIIKIHYLWPIDTRFETESDSIALPHNNQIDDFVISDCYAKRLVPPLPTHTSIHILQSTCQHLPAAFPPVSSSTHGVVEVDAEGEGDKSNRNIKFIIGGTKNTI